MQNKINELFEEMPSELKAQVESIPRLRPMLETLFKLAYRQAIADATSVLGGATLSLFDLTK